MTQIINKEAGHLHQAMPASSWKEINEVEVSGPIDFSDWQFLGSLAQKSLKKINLKETTGLRMTADLNHIFYGSPVLEEVVLPEGVTLIDEKCFEDCTQLHSITLPGSLNNIGGYAFLRCGLSQLTLPSKLKRFGPRAFADCSNLKEVTLPAGLEELGYCAFEECTSLESIDIPSGVKVLPEETFMNCVNLRKAILHNGLEEIKEGAFEYCTGLQSISLPGTVKKIGERAFKGCSSLKQISIPDGVTEIAEKTFEDCRNLVSVYLPKSVININKEAFRGCKNLKNIIFEESCDSKITSGYIIRYGIRSIDDEAFRDCINLEEISLPASIANLGSYVFRDCNSLNTIHCKAERPPFCLPKTFHWADNLKVIVPSKHKEAYQNAYGWNEVMSEQVDDDFVVNPSVANFFAVPGQNGSQKSLKTITTDEDSEDVNPSNGASFGTLSGDKKPKTVFGLDGNDSEEVNPSIGSSFGAFPNGNNKAKITGLEIDEEDEDVNPSVGASF